MTNMLPKQELHSFRDNGATGLDHETRNFSAKTSFVCNFSTHPNMLLFSISKTGIVSSII
jgi:hypothetical protein